MMSPDTHPTTVDEAVEVLLSQLDAQTKDRLRRDRREDLIGYHFELGRWIRGDFGLWNHNRALLEDTGQEHPDGASMAIIEALWGSLQTEGGL